MYWSKEKSQTMLNTPGIQFPDNIKHVDSNVIIRKANAFVNTKRKITKNKKMRRCAAISYGRSIDFRRRLRFLIKFELIRF